MTEKDQRRTDRVSLTELERLEEIIAEQSDRAQQAARLEAVGRLAGGVAHDFNNVLTTIRGYSDLVLQNLNESDPLHGDVQEIRKATERAAALTRQLLAFSRRQVLEPQPMALSTVVLEMERMLRRLIGADVDLVTHTDANLATIKADRSRIEQVIMNLAVNARDAMPEGGRLTVTTTNADLDDEAIARGRLALQPGPYVLLEVTDTGIGMADGTAFRIFEPFFTTKPQDKGTGLGLSTVYGTVKQSGGDVTVESALGQGTTFRIYLPAAPGEVVLPEPINAPASTQGGFETILLVEDEKPVRLLTKRMLARAGYKLLVARHGGEALALCEQNAALVHLVLTDIVMPEMGGQELVERLLSRQAPPRVLLMSGYSDDAISRVSKRFANIAFLHKPFSYDELTRKVRQVLDGEPVSLRS